MAGGGWTTEATKALLGIWGESSVQSQLDGVVRNKTIYLKIANDLKEMGFNHTWEQCRTKVKNLVKAYRKVRSIVIKSCSIIVQILFR